MVGFGLPYAAFAGVLAIAMRSWSVTTIRIVAYVAPLAFAGLTALRRTLAMGGGGGATWGVPILVLVFGYFYVLLAHTGYAVFRMMGWIRDDALSASSGRSPSRDR